jgi:hypothetical protein
MKQIVHVLFFLMLSWPVQAALDGNYRGQYQGRPVSAVLETISTTVTGMLNIGDTPYMLQLEGEGAQLAGQLNNMHTGESLPLRLTIDGDRLEVEVKPAAAGAMQFQLRRAD